MKVGIIQYIDCAHYIPEHDTCGRLHGHTYRIEVVVEGVKNARNMVIDFQELKKLAKEVLDEYDHKVLNEIIENPTCENLCDSIYAKLEKKLKFPFTLKIWEGRDKWVER